MRLTQLALDRRRGDLARERPVTATWLREASARIARENASRSPFTNPYSGKAYERAIAFLLRHGLER